MRKKKPIELPPITRLASLDELTAWIDKLGHIQSMKATVDMQVAVIEESRTEVTEYTDVRGFILARRPDFIRTIAELPVVRSTAFEMASNGKTFQVHLPSKNRFFVGENEITKLSKKRIYNIRPQHLQDVILIEPPRNGIERPMLDSAIENTSTYQIVNLVEVTQDGPLKLRRKLWFDGATLKLARMQIFNDKAEIVTDATFSGWQEENGLPYPGRISLYRPVDGYRLDIRILKPGLNEDVPDSAFSLDPPSGVRVERIGEEEDDKEASGNGEPEPGDG